jgi:hypothetical protein
LEKLQPKIDKYTFVQLFLWTFLSTNGEIHVHGIVRFRREELTVDSAKLKGALDALGLETSVQHDFESADGFWPVELAGVKAGGEIYLDYDVEEISEDCPVLEAALDGHDKLVTFVWHHAGEGGTALVLAAALAKLGDVVIYEPCEDVVFSPGDPREKAWSSWRKRKGTASSLRPNRNKYRTILLISSPVTRTFR